MWLMHVLLVRPLPCNNHLRCLTRLRAHMSGAMLAERPSASAPGRHGHWIGRLSGQQATELRHHIGTAYVRGVVAACRKSKVTRHEIFV